MKKLWIFLLFGIVLLAGIYVGLLFATKDRIPRLDPDPDCFCAFSPEHHCPDSSFPYLYGEYCYKNCPKGTFKVETSPNECFDKCPGNTVQIGQECKCPKETHLVRNGGKTECRCNDSNAHLNKNLCECNKGYEKNSQGLCVCEKGTFKAYGNCYSCLSETKFSGVEELECLKCTNREYLNDECVLKK